MLRSRAFDGRAVEEPSASRGLPDLDLRSYETSGGLRAADDGEDECAGHFSAAAHDGVRT